MYYVYILTNHANTVLYTGVTNDLARRVFEHREELADGFTKTYHVHKLIYFEDIPDVTVAITREKTIKNMVRRKKEELVNEFNKGWKDLYEEIL